MIAYLRINGSEQMMETKVSDSVCCFFSKKRYPQKTEMFTFETAYTDTLFLCSFGRNKRWEIHPPHSRDFSRELGGCGRPCILETLCFTFKWPKSVIRKNTVQEYWFWCLMYSSSHENATLEFFNQILRITVFLRPQDSGTSPY